MENIAKKLEELYLQRNKLDAEIYVLEQKIKDANFQILLEELANLLDRIGDGYVHGDYYAPDRYYSEIPGVKNIRVRLDSEAFPDKSNDKVVVKLTDNVLLPNKPFEFRGRTWEIKYIYSRHY